MSNLKIFCITLNPSHLGLIKKIGYIPVGLGNKSFTNEWSQDKIGKNIAAKNPYYGEYTFHYWLWKNNKLDLDGWVGFCQYRKYWKKNSINTNLKNFNNLCDITLKEITQDLNKYESILGEEIFVNQFRLSKFVKHNYKTILFNPSLLFYKKKEL